jgi:hypothetical protein
MAKLAINGGEPVVKSGLGKSWPIFDETEENALLEYYAAVLGTDARKLMKSVRSLPRIMMPNTVFRLPTAQWRCSVH